MDAEKAQPTSAGLLPQGRHGASQLFASLGEAESVAITREPSPAGLGFALPLSRPDLVGHSRPEQRDRPEAG